MNLTVQPQTPAFSGALQAKSSAPHFGNMASQSAKVISQELPGMKNLRIGRFTKTMDFQALGTATLPQIQLIYGMCILSRMYNAWKRSVNELREEVIRDSMGYTFWFFGTPILQRVFLKVLAPKPYRELLLEKQKAPTGDFASLKLADKLKRINHTINPLARYALPSSQQVKEQMHLALNKLEHAGHAPGSAEFAKVESFYKDLVKWRNFATGIGWTVTIGLIGIGINLYNIHITRQKTAHRQQNLNTVVPPQTPVSPQAFNPFGTVATR